jgi:hypothetical protein
VEKQQIHTQQPNINVNGIERTEGREIEVEIEEMQLEKEDKGEEKGEKE